MVSTTYTARAVKLAPCHRIVASRLPTIHLFERVADPADWEALYKLESMTNPRIRNEVGELSLVPVADRVSGPNASVIMAPFTHLSPQGTRFTDGHFGAYYAAESLDTAIAAPGSRGPEPSMSTTRATATRLPAPRHLSRSSRRSLTGSVCRRTVQMERSWPSQ